MSRSRRKNNEDLRRRFELIHSNWDFLFTWVLGADVYDRIAKKEKRIVGMIPLHPALLDLMRKAGWYWAGEPEGLHALRGPVVKQLGRGP